MQPNNATGTSGDVALRVCGWMLRCVMSRAEHGGLRVVNSFSENFLALVVLGEGLWLVPSSIDKVSLSKEVEMFPP